MWMKALAVDDDVAVVVVAGYEVEDLMSLCLVAIAVTIGTEDMVLRLGEAGTTTILLQIALSLVGRMDMVLHLPCLDHRTDMGRLHLPEGRLLDTGLLHPHRDLVDMDPRLQSQTIEGLLRL
jgi:hypothetical protein